MLHWIHRPAVGIANDLLAPRFGEESVRYSLLLVTVSSLSASLLFLLAACSLKRDLARPTVDAGAWPVQPLTVV